MGKYLCARLFENVEQEFLSCKSVIFLPTSYLGLLADLLEEFLCEIGFPMLAAEAEDERTAVNHALKPKLCASHTEFCLLEASEKDFFFDFKNIVGEYDRIFGQLTEISLKADLLGKDASSLTYDELKNFLGVYSVLLTKLLFSVHNFLLYKLLFSFFIINNATLDLLKLEIRVLKIVEEREVAIDGVGVEVSENSVQYLLSVVVRAAPEMKDEHA